jgi:hypothetical protein
VIVRSMLGLLVALFRRDLSKDAELLVLRHENAVLRRAWPTGRAGRVPGFVRAADGLSPGAARAELDPGHDGDGRQQPGREQDVHGEADDDEGHDGGEGKDDDPGHGDRSAFKLSWPRWPRPCLKAAAGGGRRRSGSAPVHTLMRPRMASVPSLMAPGGQ